jgi:hypothetical protein
MNPGSGSAKVNQSTAIQLRQKNNHGNHNNPMNHSSDEISNSAANKINRLKLIPEADKKNHGNHLNPINHSSDK